MENLREKLDEDWKEIEQMAEKIKAIEREKIIIKPPLGVMPKQFWIEGRFADLKRCIREYTNENLSIKMEWIIEYNELLKELGLNG